jgi:hypothetical protein
MLWLRAEAVAVLALSCVFYGRTGAHWWLFAVLFLVPDIAMVFYWLSQEAGSTAYNTVHCCVLPLLLVVLAIASERRVLLPFAIIWIAHIAFDRMLGYGLKYPGSFRETHLGTVGRTPS